MANAPTTFQCITLDPKVGRLREIVGPFGISAAFDPSTTPAAQQPSIVTFNGIWDTGATNSAITQKVVDACGLKPFTVGMVNTANGPVQRPVFLINISIFQGTTIHNVAATLGDFVGADALIGMDVITHGDFSITNEGGHTTFSFRIPSQKRIDYVRELNQKKMIGKPHGSAVNPATRRKRGRR